MPIKTEEQYNFKLPKMKNEKSMITAKPYPEECKNWPENLTLSQSQNNITYFTHAYSSSAVPISTLLKPKTHPRIEIENLIRDISEATKMDVESD